MPASSPVVTSRLWTMMFLQYAVYGLWLPLASRFLSASKEIGGLGFNDRQIGFTVGVAGAIGAMFAPFIAGQVADRWFATERCMAVLLIVGGVIKYLTAFQTSYAAWLWLSIAYAVVFMPTIALSNSLAMSHLDDPKRQFPGVRVWGTIAWIVVSWAFPMIWLQTDLKLQWLPPFFKGDNVEMIGARMLDSVKAAGILAVAYGIFCWFCLPHTPPKKGTPGIALMKAFSLMKYRSVTVLILATLLVSTVHFLYFQQTSKFLKSIGIEDAHIMPVMSIGQFAEIAAMAALGFGMRRIGFHKVLLIGAVCYAARYLIAGSYESLPVWVIVASQALHGPCFACFFAASFVYIDRIAPDEVRHSAQTCFTLVYSGLGFLISGYLNGRLAELFTSENGSLDYQRFWFTAAAMAGAATLLLLLMFRDETASAEPPATD